MEHGFLPESLMVEDNYTVLNNVDNRNMKKGLWEFCEGIKREHLTVERH